MEAFNFLSNRQIDPEYVFSSNQEMTDSDEDYTGMLKSLGSLLEKQVKTWWDIFTFEHYEKESLIFRSLRWEVSPQDGLTEQKHMDEWLEFFNKAGKKLQGLVLKRKRLKMHKLNENISALQTRLEPIKESNQLKEFNAHIKKKLE